jgi:hypothetical protein
MYPKGSERKVKKAMNPESVVMLAQGLRLVVSTLREEGQAFRCSVFEVNAREEAPLAYRVISDGFEALTCLEAQTGAYNYAKRVYPAFADRMKKPPYLIWCGPLRGL